MTSSPSTTSLFPAICAAQAAGLVAVARKTNDQTRSKYATLSEILLSVLPVLTTHGIAVMQFIGAIRVEGSIHVAGMTTRLIHSSGEWMEQDGEFPLAPPPVSKSGNQILNYSQSHGLALTYARRYALVSALGIATGDDDDAQRLLGALDAAAGAEVSYADAPAAAHWSTCVGGFWQDHDVPGEPGKILGSLTTSEMSEVRRNHWRTNPSVLANLYDEADSLMSMQGLSYSSAPKPGLGWPNDWKECTPQQVKDLFAWAKTLTTAQA